VTAGVAIALLLAAGCAPDTARPRSEGPASTREGEALSGQTEPLSLTGVPTGPSTSVTPSNRVTTTTNGVTTTAPSVPVSDVLSRHAAGDGRATTTAPRRSPDCVSGCPGPVAAQISRVLACIRSHEQGRDGYATETGNGQHGAYQFAQSTWDGVVVRLGHGEWSGKPAGHAPPQVQDAAAAQLYAERGFQPWPSSRRLCPGQIARGEFG